MQPHLFLGSAALGVLENFRGLRPQSSVEEAAQVTSRQTMCQHDSPRCLVPVLSCKSLWSKGVACKQVCCTGAPKREPRPGLLSEPPVHSALSIRSQKMLLFLFSYKPKSIASFSSSPHVNLTLCLLFFFFFF